MIAYKLVCDKCHRSANSLHPTDRWNKNDVRETHREEGWRNHKGKDFCPECAIIVLGVIGSQLSR